MINSKRTDYHPKFFKNNFYHIYNRAVGKDKLFFNDGNYRYFLKKYSFYLSDKIKTYSFCLLPNHFHLLISPETNESEVITEQFRKLFISYSMAVNKQQNRKGNLFQSNFKRKVITDNSYLIQVVYYIHANPLHHKMINDFTKYKFSSYKKIIGTGKTRLQRKEVLDWFSGINGFIEYHQERRDNVFADFYVMEE